MRKLLGNYHETTRKLSGNYQETKNEFLLYKKTKDIRHKTEYERQNPFLLCIRDARHGREKKMKMTELGGELSPETIPEELWVLSGRAKALEGYLRTELRGEAIKAVDGRVVAAIMGIELPENE